MACEFHPLAREEFENAVAYYDFCGAGLGDKLTEAVEETIKRIEQFLEAWPTLSINTRRCRTPRFPYGIVYQIETQRIVVLAVMHLHRQSNYWIDRV